MVVSRSNCKPITNSIKDQTIDKFQNSSPVTEPIAISVSNASDEQDQINIKDPEKPSKIINSVIESPNNQLLSNRPKRNIERTNYNQSKLIKKIYRQNLSDKRSSANFNNLKVKRQNRENLRLTQVAERTLRKLAEQEEPESSSPKSSINIDNLLSSISPFRKTPIIPKTSTKRSKIFHEESSDSKFAKISDRAFRYPWEWQNVQKSISSSQILGFRTLNDGLCETLMFCRK